MSKKKHCDVCNSTGTVLVDPGDAGKEQAWVTFCQDCCNHDEGFWQITTRHSEKDAGKWACNRCGMLEDKRPKNTDYKGNFVEQTKLLEL